MAKVRLDPFRPIYPTPAALITSVSADGSPNIIALGEVYNLSLSKPTIVGVSIRKATYSHGLILQSGEFVVNLPTADLVWEVDRCGTASGQKVNKFKEFGLTPVAASEVRPPLIQECPVNLECRLLGMEEVGDHDMFKGEVVAAHVDEALLDDEGRVRPERLDVLVFLLSFDFRGEYWSLGRKLADMKYTLRADESD